MSDHPDRRDAALRAFAVFWPEALKRAREVGLAKAGLDLRTATDLARQVFLAGFYDGGTWTLQELQREMTNTEAATAAGRRE